MKKIPATDRGAFMRRLDRDLTRDPALRQRVERRLNEIRREQGGEPVMKSKSACAFPFAHSYDLVSPDGYTPYSIPSLLLGTLFCSKCGETKTITLADRRA